MAADELRWDDGDYARTAATLLPAAETLVDAAAVAAGDRVLDVACGTGNAAALAVARGASVVGVDAAEGLVALAREAVPEGEFHVGRAEDLPVANAAFDVALSVFGVIFAADPARAAGELVRAVRPGGRIALTTWNPEDTIAKAGGLLAAELFPPREDPARWGDPAWVQDLLEGAGAADVEIREGRLPFNAPSPAAWFGEQEEHHPVWRWGSRRLAPAAWEMLCAQHRRPERGQRGPARLPHDEPLPRRGRPPPLVGVALRIRSSPSGGR